MKISLFKLKKNRRFNYTPRYYDGKELGNPYDFDSKFSKRYLAISACISARSETWIKSLIAVPSGVL